MPALIVARVGQNRCVHRNYFGSTQEPDGYLFQVTGLLLGTAYQQISESVKSAQLSRIGCGSSDLSEFIVQGFLDFSRLLVTSHEGLVWLG